MVREKIIKNHDCKQQIALNQENEIPIVESLKYPKSFTDEVLNAFVDSRKKYVSY